MPVTREPREMAQGRPGKQPCPLAWCGVSAYATHTYMSLISAGPVCLGWRAVLPCVQPVAMPPLSSTGEASHDRMLGSITTPSKDVSIYVFYVYGWFTCLYIYTPEEGIALYGTTVLDSCDWPCECWELDSGPLKEVLTTEQSLQPQ